MTSLSPRKTFKGTEFNVFSWTAAMDCWSFSLPAGRQFSCPFATDNLPETICGSCYAMSGNYIFAHVQRTQHARFAWLKHELDHNFDNFVDYMVDSIKALTGKVGFFRWHDSGDIFSPKYADAITKICERLPRIRFWIPTRSSDAFGRHPSMERLLKLKNVIVRKSSVFFDKGVNSEVFVYSSSVAKDETMLKGHIVCPKSKNHTSCSTEGCRKCWHKTVKRVAYIYHGYKITDKIKEKRTLYVLPS